MLPRKKVFLTAAMLGTSIMVVGTATPSWAADNVLVFAVAGLSGDPGPSSNYPDQAGVTIEDVQPSNMTGAVKISAAVKPVKSSSTGSGQTRLRFFVKTDNWMWAASSDFIDLTDGEWATVEQTFSSLKTDAGGSPNLAYVRSVGIQFTTVEGMTWSGKFLVNDVAVENASSAVYSENFEGGAGYWERADVGGNSLTLAQRPTVEDGYDYGEMPGDVTGNRVLVASVVGMTGDPGADDDYPDQAGVNVENISPSSMTTAVKITARIAPKDGLLVSGTGLVRARFFIKTDETWVWAASPEFIDLGEGSWNTIEQTFSSLKTDSGGSPSLTNVRSLGIQFTTTEGMTWSGNFLVDDITIVGGGSTIYSEDFEGGSGGWMEADVGGNSMNVLTSCRTAPESDYGSVPVLHELVAPASRGTAVYLRGTSLAVRVDARFAGGLVEVYSPAGRRIAVHTLEPCRQQTAFRLSRLAPGLHVVNIRSGRSMQTERILVAQH